MYIFTLNFIDIMGFLDPPHATAAIHEYNSKRKIPFIHKRIQDSSKIIRLSASDRKWVTLNSAKCNLIKAVQ